MKPIITILCLLIFVPYQANCQNTNYIDSLLVVYEQGITDTSGLTVASRLFNYFLYRNPDNAKKFARQELQLSQSLNYSPGLISGNYHLGLLYNNISENDSASWYYQKSMTQAKRDSDFLWMAKINHAQAIITFYKGNLDEAMEMTRQTIKYNKKATDTIGIAISYDFLGMINQNKGNYNIALKYLHRGLTMFQAARDTIRIADAYNHLATIESNLNHPKKSIEYNLRALKIYEKYNDTFYQSQALNDIGQMYLQMEDYKHARRMLNKSLAKSKEAGAKSITGTVYTNLAKMHIAQGRPQEALQELNKAYDLQKSLNEQRKQIITLNQMGNAYSALGNNEEAIKLFSKVIEKAKLIKSKSTQRYAYQYRSKAYKDTKQYALALADFEQYKTLSDTMFNTKKSRQIEELRTIHDTKQKEIQLVLQQNKIIALNTKISLSKTKTALLVVGLISTIIIAALIYFSLRQTQKKRAIKHQKEQDLLRQELAYKKKQLVSQTLHLVQKSTFMQELKDNLEKIGKSKETFKIEFRRIVMLLRKETAMDKEWETFKSYFVEVHNDFETKIKEISKDITEHELRLASFLKMNLTTKEIASILNVMPDSVLKSKYRLKKKLNLPRKDDLYHFLKGL